MENVQTRRGLLALFGGLVAATAVTAIPSSPAEAQVRVEFGRPVRRRRRWRRRVMRRRPIRRCRTRINRWGERVRVCRTW